MKNYNFDKLIYDRWAVWYMNFPKRKGSKIGVYRIIDLYSGTRETRFAFRYLPREGQDQEQSDDLIITNTIRKFYRTNIFFEKTKIENV